MKNRREEPATPEAPMEKIASFTVNHLALEPGVYVSRVDADPATGAVVTTFDQRLTAPNREPVLDTAAVHAIEHLGATYLRNSPEWASRVVYFGPMGCRVRARLRGRDSRRSPGGVRQLARRRPRAGQVVGAPLPGGHARAHRRGTPRLSSGLVFVTDVRHVRQYDVFPADSVAYSHLSCWCAERRHFRRGKRRTIAPLRLRCGSRTLLIHKMSRPRT